MREESIDDCRELPRTAIQDNALVVVNVVADVPDLGPSQDFNLTVNLVTSDPDTTPPATNIQGSGLDLFVFFNDNEITFNSSLLKELRAIEFVQRLLDDGRLTPEEYRRLHVHVIENEDALKPLGASSKLNAEWAFLTHLRDLGRETAAHWLDRHFEDLGERSTVDLKAMFQEIGPPHSG